MVPHRSPTAMESLTDGEAVFRDFDQLVLAHCHRLLPFEGSRLASEVPEPLLAAALTLYLDLRDDETLLMIAGGGKKGRAGATCALTTKRIYWPGKPKRGAEWRAEAPEGGHPSSWSRSLAYADLPGSIRRRPG